MQACCWLWVTCIITCSTIGSPCTLLGRGATPRPGRRRHHAYMAVLLRSCGAHLLAASLVQGACRALAWGGHAPAGGAVSRAGLVAGAGLLGAPRTCRGSQWSCELEHSRREQDCLMHVMGRPEQDSVQQPTVV